MCAPRVLDVVRRELSRRELFKLSAGAALGGAALAMSPRAAAQPSSLELGTLSDLTHTLSERFPVFPAFEPMRITNLVTVEHDGFYANRWDLSEHSGTHMDAPAHFMAGASTADQLPLESLIAPLAVIDIAPIVPRAIPRRWSWSKTSKLGKTHTGASPSRPRS